MAEWIWVSTDPKDFDGAGLPYRLRLEDDFPENTLIDLVDESITSRSLTAQVVDVNERFIFNEEQARWLHQALGELLIARAQAARPKVPRGHCGKCDRCGWPLAESAEKGCVLGNCSQRPLLSLRSTCAGCGAPFEETT
jgi:hypothetical protein